MITIRIDFDPATHMVTNIDCGQLPPPAAVGILCMALEEVKFVANTGKVQQMQLAAQQRMQQTAAAQQKANQINKVVLGR